MQFLLGVLVSPQENGHPLSWCSHTKSNFSAVVQKIAYSHLRNSASRISIIGYVLLDGLIQRNERRGGAPKARREMFG